MKYLIIAAALFMLAACRSEATPNALYERTHIFPFNSSELKDIGCLNDNGTRRCQVAAMLLVAERLKRQNGIMECDLRFRMQEITSWEACKRLVLDK